MDKENFKVTVNGVDFDFNSVLPFKIKDWLALQKLGVDISNFDGSLNSMTNIALHLMKKAKPDLQAGFVDELTLTQVSDLAKMVTNAEEAGVDRPT